MEIQRILCPIDFSDFSNALNEHASQLAASSGATLIYLHVHFPDVPYGSYEFVNLEEEAEHLLEQLRRYQPSQSDVKAEYAIEYGTPASTIVRFAKEHSVDMIVMGTHGRTGWRRVLMGSVAEDVVRHSPVPVLAVKPETPAEEATTPDSDSA